MSAKRTEIRRFDSDQRNTEQTLEGKITLIEACAGIDRGSSRGIIMPGTGAYARSVINLQSNAGKRTVTFPAILPLEIGDSIRCKIKGDYDNPPYCIEKLRDGKVVATYKTP